MTKISLRNPIRKENIDMEEVDILGLKKALGAAGYYDVPSYGVTPYPDEKMFKAIRNFQSDRGLTVDGIVNPDGETIKSLNSEIQKISARAPMVRCPVCGGPHGGSKGDICPDCSSKQS